MRRILRRRAKEHHQEMIQASQPTISEQKLHEHFDGCGDIQKEKMAFGTNRDINILFTFSEGLCDTDQLRKEVIPRLEKIVEENQDQIHLPHFLVREWHSPNITLETDIQAIMEAVFDGKVVIYIINVGYAYTIDISDRPQRSPEEANTEVTIKGARDAFIEDIEVNVALVRKRLRTNSLKYEPFFIGTRSKTKVALLYVDDVIQPRVLQEVRRRLHNVNVDALFSSDQLEEYLYESRFPIFPLFHYTGRPDFVIDSLLSGRFIIIADGMPVALIGPINFFMLLKTSEDTNILHLYNSFERILRIFGLWIACFLPGFWVALITFHPDQLPLILVAGLSQVRQGVPLPAPLETLLMMVLFEMFREAGIRLPVSIGQVLAVVGGIIVGDAAIRAGLTSPATIVVVATSAVAAFTLVNQSLQGVVSVLRLGVLLFSSMLGIYGFLIFSFLVVLYVANLRSFGLPYMSPISPLNIRDATKALFRPSERQRNIRPETLRSADADQRRSKG